LLVATTHTSTRPLRRHRPPPLCLSPVHLFEHTVLLLQDLLAEFPFPVQTQRIAQTVEGLFVAPMAGVDKTEAVIRPRVVRLEIHRAAIRRLRFVQPVQIEQRVPAQRPKRRIDRVVAQGLGHRGERRCVVLLAEQEQPGILPKNRPVAGQLPGRGAKPLARRVDPALFREPARQDDRMPQRMHASRP
jgi:hypothetical protein